MGTVFGPQNQCNNIAWENSNPAVRSKVAAKVMTNPMIMPQQFQATATLTNGGGITQIYLNDAIQLGIILGLVGGSNSQTMTVPTVTAAVLRSFLLSYALVISGYDFECDNSSELAKNLVMATSSIDQTSASTAVFSSRSRNNMQNNPDLLNIADGFVWLPTTSLKMTTAAPAADTVYTFTFYVEACVPHAQLDQYLAARGAR